MNARVACVVVVVAGGACLPGVVLAPTAGALAPITGLAAVDPQTGHELDVSWTTPPHVSSVRLLRGKNGACPKSAVDDSADVVFDDVADSFADVGLPNDQEVCYVAFAVYGGAQFANASPPARAVPSDDVAPLPVVGLALEPRANGNGVDLAWTLPTEAIDHVSVRVRPDATPISDSDGEDVAVGADRTSAFDDQATPPDHRFYAVFTVDDAGNASEAVSGDIVLVDVDAPPAPASAAAFALDDQRVLVAWAPSPGPPRPAAYDLLRDGALFATIVEQSPPAFMTAVDDGLSASSAHVYSVLAIDDVGNGSAAVTASATTAPRGPGAIAVITAEPSSAGVFALAGCLASGADLLIAGTTNEDIPSLGLIASPQPRAFIARLGDAGTPVWSAAEGNATTASALVRLDPSTIALCGTYTSTGPVVSADGSVVINLAGSSAPRSDFCARYDDDGSLVDALAIFTAGSASISEPHAVATGLGDLVVAIQAAQPSGGVIANWFTAVTSTGPAHLADADTEDEVLFASFIPALSSPRWTAHLTANGATPTFGGLAAAGNDVVIAGAGTGYARTGQPVEAADPRVVIVDASDGAPRANAAGLGAFAVAAVVADGAGGAHAVGSPPQGGSFGAHHVTSAHAVAIVHVDSTGAVDASTTIDAPAAEELPGATPVTGAEVIAFSGALPNANVGLLAYVEGTVVVGDAPARLLTDPMGPVHAVALFAFDAGLRPVAVTAVGALAGFAGGTNLPRGALTDVTPTRAAIAPLQGFTVAGEDAGGWALVTLP